MDIIIIWISGNDTKRYIMSNFYKKFQDLAISPPIVWLTYKTRNKRQLTIDNYIPALSVDANPTSASESEPH